MREGAIAQAPIWDDVQTLRGELVQEVDIIYGGFPCQDISVAGTGEGLAGKRSGLFFEIVRLVDEIRPPFVFLENVPAITTRGLGEVTAAFTRLRYDCRWGIISAFEVGAPHLRKRWFMLAYGAHTMRERFKGDKEPDGKKPQSESEPRCDLDRLCNDLSDTDSENLRKQRRRRSGTQGQGEVKPNDDGKKKSVAHAHRAGSQGGGCEMGRISKENQVWTFDALKRGGEMGDTAGERWKKGWPEHEVFGWEKAATSAGWWSIEPNVGRVVNGLPFRVDRISGLGNAVVPLQAREAFKRLMGIC